MNNLTFEHLNIAHSIDTTRLSSCFFSEDDIGVMVRCHFEVERAVSYSLDVITDKRWTKARGKYLSDQLNLLEVLGVPLHVLAPARTLNKQRNSFAHDGTDQLSEQMLLDVLRGVRKIFPQFHDEYNIEFQGPRPFKGKFKECTLRQRYTVTSVILSSLMAGLPQFLKEYYKHSGN